MSAKKRIPSNEIQLYELLPDIYVTLPFGKISNLIIDVWWFALETKTSFGIQSSGNIHIVLKFVPLNNPDKVISFSFFIILPGEYPPP